MVVCTVSEDDPRHTFAYMWVFAVLPALTSAIVVVKAVTIFLGDPQRAPLWSSTERLGLCSFFR
jgi:hypothetical protein